MIWTGIGLKSLNLSEVINERQRKAPILSYCQLGFRKEHCTVRAAPKVVNELLWSLWFSWSCCFNTDFWALGSQKKQLLVFQMMLAVGRSAYRYDGIFTDIISVHKDIMDTSSRQFTQSHPKPSDFSRVVRWTPNWSPANHTTHIDKHSDPWKEETGVTNPNRGRTCKFHSRLQPGCEEPI